MNKHMLMSQMKSTGTAYLCFFFGAFHYAYLGKWGLQFLFWFTLGGVGIWWLIDLFTISSKVDAHNYIISQQIEQIEKGEKEDAHMRNMQMMAMATGGNRNVNQGTA
ncbi:TM2 domain-containing protein [Nonlabens ponticola]|uniref:TM2 domain-containing protein n=1 Tax=Nonlabens ponticola TaxID=2496866 RepID=A0A3S9MX56_9FLAO|nr:TM2 domain-containing protein [Nonlabens ponticola]AZQ43719.1 TM2 domain-containing protein [Nonlabens ponticola]